MVGGGGGGGGGERWNIKQNIRFLIADVFIRLRAFAHILFYLFFFQLLTISQHEHLQPGLQCSCLPVRNSCLKKKTKKNK